MDDIGCPKLQSLEKIDTTKYVRNCHPYAKEAVCAVKNAHALKEWLLVHYIPTHTPLPEDEDEGDCGCSRHAVHLPFGRAEIDENILCSMYN